MGIVRSFRSKVSRRLTVSVGIIVGLAPASSLAQPTGIVISQVYGGGGNAGAPYGNDYIELFNATSSPQSLSGYSLQYASATGTSYQVFALPQGATLAPGHFYLVEAAAGAGEAAALPTPDSCSSLALSSSAGKIALVDTTTALSGVAGCPVNDSSVLDYVSFGTSANCALGEPTRTLSNTTAAIRRDVCTDTRNNSVDFAVDPPAPRNASSMAHLCSAAAGVLTASAKATPASVYAGGASLLTVNVSPATQIASTGIQVAADLRAIGGPSSDGFYDDGTHGDFSAGDDIFSLSVTPGIIGDYTLPVSVRDAQMRTASASIALAVAAPPPTVSIRAIQAAKPSSFAGQTVNTTGVVIGVRSSGFYLEALDADTHPATPEGLYVYTGTSPKPEFVAVGAVLQVSGKLSTYPSSAVTPATELGAPLSYTLVSSGHVLPRPVEINAAQDSPLGGLHQFTKFEGMRVRIASLTTTSGTGASLNEQTETQTTNGTFYGVVTGVPRPFREPGIALNDTAFSPIPASVPRWDANPEVLQIGSSMLGGTPLNLTSQTTLTGVVGVMDFSTGGPEILLDADKHPGISGGLTPQPLPLKSLAEFTIGSFNMERFYNDKADADNPGSVAVTVTPEAYARRLNKASLAIRSILNNPDILGAQEIENITVLTDLANKVNQDTVASGQIDPQYVPYLSLANDGTAINTGFLVKSSTVNTVSVEQVGPTTTFTNAEGKQAILNDRTPLVLHAGLNGRAARTTRSPSSTSTSAR